MRLRRPVLLWVDFCEQSSDPGLDACLASAGSVHRCDSADNIPAMIQDFRPDVLCFDFDYPGAEGLKALQATKFRFPSLPILMFSEETSMELALWALRARVWDLLIKPVGAGKLCSRLNMLRHIHEQQLKRRSRNVYMPTMSLPHHSAPASTNARISMSSIANFVNRHMHEKISLATVAHLSGMGTYEFSRAFRREQGVTFRDFLIRLRINRAAALLRDTRISVLEVACAVGINDPSQFARVFRRCIGVTPSVYRNRNSLTLRAAVPRAGAGVPKTSIVTSI